MRAMRRWLTLVLLFVLPLQFAWAAAAVYCQHERAPSSTHVGHHTHEHKAAEGASKVSDAHEAQVAKPGKLAADNDCGYCHLSFAKPLVPLGLQFHTGATLRLDSPPGPNFGSRGPDLLDRPNWRIA